MSVPPLREDVALEPRDDGGGSLSDPLFGRRIKLDARGLGICRALARAGGPAELDAIASEVGAPLEVVRGFVDKLVALDLCATERAAVRVAERRALARVMREPARHLATLAGARFACTMCGSCCGGHNIGPVSEAVLDGLGAAMGAIEPEVRAARRIDKPVFVVLPGAGRDTGGDGDAQVMCQVSDGSCVFLDDLGRCRIHAALGGDKKPLPCRTFPWELVATPSGVRVAVQRECRDFLRATADEQPLVDESRAELEALVAALAEAGGLPVARSLPVLRGRELDSWAAWEAIESELMAIVATCDGVRPRETFAALAARLGAAGPGGAGASFQLWREHLKSPLETMRRAAPAPDERVRISIDALELGLEALEHARGWVLARALGEHDAEVARLFKSHLEQALWATTIVQASSVEAGLGRLVAEWVLARLIALVRARRVKRFHVTAQDVQDGLTIASFLFRHDDLRPLLTQLDPLTTAVFVDDVSGLFARAADLDEPDRRAELVKF